MHDFKNACDGALVCAAAATLAGWLPTIVSMLALVLTVMRIITEWEAFKNKLRRMLDRRRK